MLHYNKILFEKYHQIHGAFLDEDEQAKFIFFKKYFAKNYFQHLKPFNSQLKILEIGCNKGYLLNAISKSGFQHVFGIDLSPEDIEFAKKNNPEIAENIICADAYTYLANHEKHYDAIILKAVLEHVPKNDSIKLLEKIEQALNDKGTVIIDVPNMDWLFASHERYMDFTHEVGFTKESLAQLMRIHFTEVKIIPVDHHNPDSFFKILKKKLSRLIINKLLNWTDPEGAMNPIWHRSIIGTGHKKQ